MGSYWSVPYLTKKSVHIEPAVKHDTTEVKKATVAESVKEMVANDMLHIEPFVELQEKRALTPIIEEQIEPKVEKVSIETHIEDMIKAKNIEISIQLRDRIQSRREAIEGIEETKEEQKEEKKEEQKEKKEEKKEVIEEDEEVIKQRIALNAEICKEILSRIVNPIETIEVELPSLSINIPVEDTPVLRIPEFRNNMNSASHAIKKFNKKHRKN